MKDAPLLFGFTACKPPEPPTEGRAGRFGAAGRGGPGPLQWCTLRALLVALALISAALPSWAKDAVPAVADPVLEARVMAIAEELRCLVCQNETLAASQADLAVDLRKQIGLQLQAGKSKQDIIDYLVARYGDFVLYRPPLMGRTLLLWFGPFVLLLGALGLLVFTIRRRRQAVSAESGLTPAQAERARALLDESAGPS